MPSIIDGQKPSIPAKVEEKIKAGLPKRQAMATSGKPVQKPVVRV